MKHRSAKKELMDDLNLANEDLVKTLQDIEKLNRLFGGHRSVINGLQIALEDVEFKNKKPHLVEIGCGMGDNLEIIRKTFGSSMYLKGIDANSFIIDKAMEAFPNDDIEFSHKKMNTEDFTHLNADIVLMGLFLHHFNDSQIVRILSNIRKSKVRYIVITDLKRSSISLILYRIIGTVLGLNSMARNDGAISIQRGFKLCELEGFAEESGYHQKMIRPVFAFRYLMVLKNSDENI